MGASGSLVVGVEEGALALQMKVIGVEHGRVHQPGKVRDGEPAPVDLHQTVRPQALKRPVDVHGGKPGSFRQIILRQREIAPVGLARPTLRIRRNNSTKR